MMRHCARKSSRCYARTSRRAASQSTRPLTGLAGRPLQRDDRLGSYEIIELLGAGSGCSTTLPRRSATRFRRVAHHRGQIARESSGGIGTNRCAIWWSISADCHGRPSRPVRRVRRGAETTGGRRGDWSIELVRSEVGRATGEVVVDGCKRRPHRPRPAVVSSGTPPARQLSARAGGRDWRHAYQSVDRNRSLLRPICGSETR